MGDSQRLLKSTTIRSRSRIFPTCSM